MELTSKAGALLVAHLYVMHKVEMTIWWLLYVIPRSEECWAVGVMVSLVVLVLAKRLVVRVVSSVLLLFGIMFPIVASNDERIADLDSEYIARVANRGNFPAVTPEFFAGELPDRIRRVRSETPFEARTYWIYAQFSTISFEDEKLRWKELGLELKTEKEKYWLFRAPSWFPTQSVDPHDATYRGRLEPVLEPRDSSDWGYFGDFLPDVYYSEGEEWYFFLLKDGGVHRNDDFLRLGILDQFYADRWSSVH